MIGSVFLTYVKRKFKREDKDTEIYQATTDTIADMRLQFKSEDYKEETYSSGISTIGEYKLGLPSDYGHIIGNISIIDTDADEKYPTLRKISKEKYDEKYNQRLLTDADSMDTATPTEFCIYAKQIYVGPVPDKTTYRYQFNYTTEDYTEIAADTDPVPFASMYRNVLRSGVLAEIHDGLENFEESAYWRAMYLQGLGKIADNDEDNIRDDDGVQFRGI